MLLNQMGKIGTTFKVDPYPGKPKILFIGLAQSTHTHAWIDLLDKAELNVRLFALPKGLPPTHWPVKTYVSKTSSTNLDPDTRAWLPFPGLAKRVYKKGLARLYSNNSAPDEEKWLAQVIRQWQPDIIHTLGLDPSGYFYFRVRHRFKLAGVGQWVLQLRGGSDLTLNRLDPVGRDKISRVLGECDQLVSDNQQNFDFGMELGLREEQISPLAPVPGTGGVEVEALSQSWPDLPSHRRLILWPKAYESPWSKALPVFEALKLAWDQIQPCQIYMLTLKAEAQMWYRTLPEQIRQCCYAEARIPRDRVLQLMLQARVMLAPSLIDGTPNTLFEAMAAGAFPILSPLDTIRSLVESEKNVLFARNLYPHEIAEALRRAMTDDTLVDRAVERNLKLVRQIANRATIRLRVINYYEQLAKEDKKECRF